eukprot:1969443-Prymnesium_polylepis.1
MGGSVCPIGRLRDALDSRAGAGTRTGGTPRDVGQSMPAGFAWTAARAAAMSAPCRCGSSILVQWSTVALLMLCMDAAAAAER